MTFWPPVISKTADIVLDYLQHAPEVNLSWLKINGGHHHGLHDAKLQILIYFREKYKSHRANIFSFLSLHITPGNDPSEPCCLLYKHRDFQMVLNLLILCKSQLSLSKCRLGLINLANNKKFTQWPNYPLKWPSATLCQLLYKNKNFWNGSWLSLPYIWSQILDWSNINGGQQHGIYDAKPPEMTPSDPLLFAISI